MSQSSIMVPEVQRIMPCLGNFTESAAYASWRKLLKQSTSSDVYSVNSLHGLNELQEDEYRQNDLETEYVCNYQGDDNTSQDVEVVDDRRLHNGNKRSLEKSLRTKRSKRMRMYSGSTSAVTEQLSTKTEGHHSDDLGHMQILKEFESEFSKALEGNKNNLTAAKVKSILHMVRSKYKKRSLRKTRRRNSKSSSKSQLTRTAKANSSCKTEKCKGGGDTNNAKTISTSSARVLKEINSETALNENPFLLYNYCYTANQNRQLTVRDVEKQTIDGDAQILASYSTGTCSGASGRENHVDSGPSTLPPTITRTESSSEAPLAVTKKSEQFRKVEIVTLSKKKKDLDDFLTVNLKRERHASSMKSKDSYMPSHIKRNRHYSCTDLKKDITGTPIKKELCAFATSSRESSAISRELCSSSVIERKRVTVNMKDRDIEAVPRYRRANHGSMSLQLSTEVIVKHLPLAMSDEDLFLLFRKRGWILSSCVVRCHYGYSYGFGFVKFSTKEGAMRAIKKSDGLEVDGHVLKVSLSMKNDIGPEGSTLFIRNLPAEFSATELHMKFARYGLLDKSRLLPVSEAYPYLRTGFVKYCLDSDAVQAMKQMKGVILPDASLPLDICFATESVFDSFWLLPAQSMEEKTGKEIHYQNRIGHVVYIFHVGYCSEQTLWQLFSRHVFVIKVEKESHCPYGSVTVKNWLEAGSAVAALNETMLHSHILYVSVRPFV